MTREVDMARYVLHRLNVDRYAQLAVNGTLTMAEAVDSYDRAMENAELIMKGNNYANNMRDLARGGAECIQEQYDLIRSKGIHRPI